MCVCSCVCVCVCVCLLMCMCVCLLMCMCVYDHTDLFVGFRKQSTQKMAHFSRLEGYKIALVGKTEQQEKTVA